MIKLKCDFDVLPSRKLGILAAASSRAAPPLFWSPVPRRIRRARDVVQIFREPAATLGDGHQHPVSKASRRGG
jgi:hypothetical protein